MEEYDDHRIDTVVQLDAYERERRQQTGELGPNTNIPPSPTDSRHTVLVSDAKDTTEPEQAKAQSMHRPEREHHTTDADRRAENEQHCSTS